MSKVKLQCQKSHPQSRPSRSFYFALIIVVCILLLQTRLRWSTAGFFPSSPVVPLTSEVEADFKWSRITPTVDLEWHECFEEFHCAKLDLPLDWLESSNKERIALALIRLEATEKHNYKGPVFVNPGGPGGSGVSMLQTSGKALQTIVGRNHDIISFDPRGVGLSTPQTRCYPSPQTAKIWNLLDVGLIDSHPGVLYDAYARATAYSSACNGAIGGFNSSVTESEYPDDSDNSKRVSSAGPGRFVSTASVARDMLEVLDKGGWGKLKYWGFSYGTVLGTTFAAMYPDRVERMINDGNVNVIQWTTNTHLSFLQDSDRVMQAFYIYCQSSGLETCPFYDSSPAVIEQRLNSLLQHLKTHPVIVPSPLTTEGFPQIVSYSSVKSLIDAALYRPILLFPMLAEILLALENGDGVPFLRFTEKAELRTPFIPGTDCGDRGGGGNGEEVLTADSNEDAFRAIMCSDGGEMTDTAEAFENYANSLMNVSKSVGAAQSSFRMSCAGWKVKAKWRFTGPFTGNTSHPILFIANSADNVTPLQSALNNSAGFPNSLVLIQEAFGHTSLAAPSICTASHVRAYFQNGTLPQPGTRCPSDMTPFQIGTGQDVEYEEYGTREVKEALLHLMGNMKIGFKRF